MNSPDVLRLEVSVCLVSGCNKPKIMNRVKYVFSHGPQPSGFHRQSAPLQPGRQQQISTVTNPRLHCRAPLPELLWLGLNCRTQARRHQLAVTQRRWWSVWISCLNTSLKFKNYIIFNRLHQLTQLRELIEAALSSGTNLSKSFRTFFKKPFDWLSFNKYFLKPTKGHRIAAPSNPAVQRYNAGSIPEDSRTHD